MQVLDAGADAHDLPRPVEGIDGECEDAVVIDPHIKARKIPEDEEDDAGRHPRAEIEPRPDGEPDACNDPKRRRRCEARDGQALLHDRTGAEKADAADDLRRKPCGIGVRLALDVVVERLRQEHDETRTERNEHIRPQTCRLVPHLPLIADDAAHDAGEHEPQADFPFLHR